MTFIKKHLLVFLLGIGFVSKVLCDSNYYVPHVSSDLRGILGFNQKACRCSTCSCPPHIRNMYYNVRCLKDTVGLLFSYSNDPLNLRLGVGLVINKQYITPLDIAKAYYDVLLDRSLFIKEAKRYTDKDYDWSDREDFAYAISGVVSNVYYGDTTSLSCLKKVFEGNYTIIENKYDPLYKECGLTNHTLQSADIARVALFVAAIISGDVDYSQRRINDILQDYDIKIVLEDRELDLFLFSHACLGATRELFDDQDKIIGNAKICALFALHEQFKNKL
jgi:hypothetical protein